LWKKRERRGAPQFFKPTPFWGFSGGGVGGAPTGSGGGGGGGGKKNPSGIFPNHRGSAVRNPPRWGGGNLAGGR